MPTARPIITASEGVMLLSSVKCVAMSSPSAPSPTPMTAESSGIPAATSEPKVKMRTTKATPSPMISEVEFTSMSSPKPAPPASTCSPFSRPKFIASVTMFLSSALTEYGLFASKAKVV